MRETVPVTHVVRCSHGARKRRECGNGVNLREVSEWPGEAIHHPPRRLAGEYPSTEFVLSMGEGLRAGEHDDECEYEQLLRQRSARRSTSGRRATWHRCERARNR